MKRVSLALLAVLLVASVSSVASSESVSAAEVASSFRKRCVMGYVGAASSAQIVQRCYWNPATPSVTTWDTTAPGSGSTGAEQNHIGTNHSTTGGTIRYYAACSGTTTATWYRGPTTTPWGPIGLGEVLIVNDGGLNCSSVYTGVKASSDSGLGGLFWGGEHDSFTFTTAGFTGTNGTTWWGGQVPDPGSLALPDDWFPGNDAPTPDPCLGLLVDVDFVSGNVGPTYPNDIVVSDGVEVGIKVESNGFPVGEAADISFRFHSGQAFASAVTVGGPFPTFPYDFSFTRAGPAHLLGEVEIRCDDLTGSYYWTPGEVGWDTEEGVADCRSLDFAFQWLYDGDTEWQAPWEPVDRVLLPSTIRLVVSGATLTDTVTFVMRARDASDVLWESDPVQLTPGTFLPAELLFVPPADGSLALHLDGLTVRCVDAAGESYDATPGGGGFSEPSSESGSGRCFTFDGMSLTSPKSWVSGIGRMFVCIGEWFFVPDDPAGWAEDQVEQLQSEAPFSYAATGIEALDALTDPSPSGVDSCIGISLPDQAPADACIDQGALNTLYGASGSFIRQMIWWGNVGFAVLVFAMASIRMVFY